MNRPKKKHEIKLKKGKSIIHKYITFQNFNYIELGFEPTTENFSV